MSLFFSTESVNLSSDCRQAARCTGERTVTLAAETGWVGEGAPPTDLGGSRGGCRMVGGSLKLIGCNING